MTSLVTSDLHLGSEFCDTQELSRFIASLPDDAELILNGDLFDRYGFPLNAASQAVFDQLLQRATQHPVYWLQGNHDRTLSRRLPDHGAIRTEQQLIRNHTILIEHGDRFESILHYARPATKVVYLLYLLWQRITGHRAHVASYAKQWSFLYQGFCRYMKRNAVQAAAAAHCTTVICGHSHHPEDTTINGIRYINTGAWTEKPIRVVNVTNTRIAVVEISA